MQETPLNRETGGAGWNYSLQTLTVLGEQPIEAMATNHKVQQGEHLSSIALRYGFADYRTVWGHASNKEFKEKRSNPNVLLPGDTLYIPDKQLKKERCATGQWHRFVAVTQTLMLQILVQDADDQPIGGTPCKLEIEGQSYQLSTNSEGLLKQLIPKNAVEGKLTINDSKRSIEMEMPIRIGHLDPVEEPSGWRARLNNLGYCAGASLDPHDLQLRSAIEEFQCDYGLTVDGICGPRTQAKLKQAHGC